MAPFRAMTNVAIAGGLFSALILQTVSFRTKLSPKNLEKEQSLVDTLSPPSNGTKALDWLLNNMVQIPTESAEKKLREAEHQVLLPPNQEHVERAFKVGNDKTFFTNKRILLRPKNWLSGSTLYQSIPWDSLLTFGVETAGYWPDQDTKLWFWTKMTDVPYFSLEFKKANENAQIYDILKYVNSKMLGPDSGESALIQTEKKGIIDLFHWLNGNMAEIDKAETERIFKTEMPILQQDEIVEKAFQTGGDRTLITNKRLVRVDMALFIGKTISYDFIPWSAIQAFAVHSAGFLDSNSEMTVWTSVPARSSAANYILGIPEPPRVFKQNLRSFAEGTPDVVEIQSLFAKYVLGPNKRERVLPATEISKHAGIPGGGKRSTGAEILSFLLGNFSTAHPGQAEGRLRAMAPILQEHEHVEMAFQKNAFENDLIYLTTKRVIFADIKKLFHWDDAIEYLSIPYDSIKLFSTETAATLDLDCMFTMYTGIHPPPPLSVPVGKHGSASGKSTDPNADPNADATKDASLVQSWARDNGDPPAPSPGPENKKEKGKNAGGPKTKLVAVPGMSMIEVALRTGTDINAIQQLLYSKVLHKDGYESSFLEQEKSSPASKNPIMNFIHWLDGNAKEFSPEEAEKQLRAGGPILVGDEKVLKAFTTWRDLTLLTSTRLLVADIQYLSLFQKVVYTSVPYKNIHGFGIQSAGTFDLDATMMFYTTSKWKPYVQQDLARRTSDIAELQTFLCDRIVPSGPNALLETGSAEPTGGFLNWLGNNEHEFDAQEAEDQLLQAKVLQVGEKVKLAYKVGYDKTLYTNRRILHIDVSDWDLFSRKVEYKTIPYTSVIGFSVQTSHGYFDWDEEVTIYTDMYDFGKLAQDIASGNKDVYQIQMLLAGKSLD